MDILFKTSVFLHVVAAVLLVGGTFFFRIVLHKYAERTGGLTDELKATLQKRWIHTSWNLVLVLLVTGVFQMFQRLEAWRDTAGHMIFGIKFLLFLGVVAVLAMVTASKGEKAVRRPKLMLINIGLGVAIIGLSTWLARVAM